MRKALACLAVASVAFAASPSFANEARVEARTGLVWDSHGTTPVAGGAIGYDVDIGDRFFVGVEGSADKILEGDTRVSWGAGGRAGVKVLPQTKVYAASTWQSKPCSTCNSAVGVGGGVQQGLSKNFYAKAEYKHLLVGDNTPDSDVGMIGVGLKF